MKIILIYPLDRDFMPPSMPPMGLAYIAAALIQQGHKVSIIDLNGDRKNGMGILKSALAEGGFDLIGISSIITQFKRVKDLGRLIKAFLPETPLIMGGPGPTSIPQLHLDHCGADVICIGEGEETIKELVRIIAEKDDIKKCRGIAYKDNNNIIEMSAKRESIANIDTISFPDWENFTAMDIYTHNYLFRNGKERGLSILSTRGCPGQCNYCMCNFGRRLRIRSAENIFDEIESLIENYNIQHIHFIDDTFIVSAARINYFCREFRKKFRNLTWSANVRADMVKLDCLKLMKEAGCISLAYGIESGSPAILEYIKKGVSVEQAINAIKWTREAGIFLTAYFMIGMPPETSRTIRETVDFCKDNLVGGEFFFATPFPGTALYEYARQRKLINDEALYLEYAGEVRDFVINLTAMTNEELFILKEEAENEIKEHLARHNIPVRPSIRKDPRETAAFLPKF